MFLMWFMLYGSVLCYNSCFVFRIMCILREQIDNLRIYVANDGTEVTDEEYFRTLDAQTLFVIANRSEHVQTGKLLKIYFSKNNYKMFILDFELMCDKIQSSVSLIEQGKIIKLFLKENMATHSISTLLNLKNKLESHEENTLLLCSTRDKHPEWFIGKRMAYRLLFYFLCNIKLLKVNPILSTPKRN